MKTMSKIIKTVYIYSLAFISLIFFCGIEDIVANNGILVTLFLFLVLCSNWAVIYYTYTTRDLLITSGYLWFHKILTRK